MLLPVTDIIKQSVQIYRDHFSLWLRYIGLFSIPSVLTAIASIPFTAAVEQRSYSNVGLYGLLLAILGIVSIYLSIPFIRAMAAIIDNKKPQSIAAALNTAKPLVWPLIATSVLISLAVAAGFIFFIIPGIVCMVWFSFTSYAVILDGKKYTGAMTYSKSLVLHRWWPVAWRLFVPAILFMFLSWVIKSIVAFPFDKALSIEPTQTISIFLVILSTVASLVVTLLFVPLTTAAPTILYRNLKESR